MSEQGPGSAQERAEKARKHLWFTPDKGRFFLIPHDLTLPPGDFVIRSAQAVRATVVEASLAPFEVDITAARAHVNAGWEEVLGPVQQAWRDLLGSQAEEGSSPPLADWLGVSPGEAITDPEKARQARKALVERAASLLGRELSPEQLDRFEASLDRLGSAVVRDAERLRTSTAELADELEARRPQIEARLEATGESLIEMGQKAFARLRGLGLGGRPASSSRSSEAEPQRPDASDDARETSSEPIEDAEEPSSDEGSRR